MRRIILTVDTSRRSNGFADLDGPDFFPTPAWATYALIDNERFDGEVWEPACGDGAMSRVLEDTACTPVITAPTCMTGGYGEAGVEFRDHEGRKADNIVTNPPYNMAEAFVRGGVSASRKK